MSNICTRESCMQASHRYTAAVYILSAIVCEAVPGVLFIWFAYAKEIFWKVMGAVGMGDGVP